MTLKDHYLDAYGQYTKPPDYSRCCASVIGSGEWYTRQCSRGNGQGPDGAYCKQHDPAIVAKKKADAKSRHDAAWLKRRKEIAGPRWFNVLKQIADGHNDPRSLAREAIEGYE